MAGQGAARGGAGGAGGAAPAGGAGGSGHAGGAPGTAPEVLILLDRSSSMNERVDGTTCPNTDCGADSKWSLVKAALEGALPPYEDVVNWGLKLFASSNACGVSQGVEIAPGLTNAAVIATRLEEVTPSTSTPTTAAETAAANYLRTLATGAPKYILLITDGIPTCGVQTCAPDATGQVSTQCDDANAIAAVQAVRDTAGIPTMVVGVGTDLGTGTDTLQKMAVAGGLPRSSSPAYYPVQTTADLMAAIQALTAAAGL